MSRIAGATPTDADRPQLLPGTLDMMILSILREAPLHGYGIARAIERRSGRMLEIEEGSLYPALSRLHKRGALDVDWRTSPTGRRAKFFRLTVLGRHDLVEQSALWGRLTEAVGRVLGGGPVDMPM